VGALVDKAISVEVADGGNQFMVAVGSGISVAVRGMGVARIASSWAQDVKNVIASIVIARAMFFRPTLAPHASAGEQSPTRRGDCFVVKNKNAPRNDEKGEGENIIFIW
jgi:hypothetical protein